MTIGIYTPSYPTEALLGSGDVGGAADNIDGDLNEWVNVTGGLGDLGGKSGLQTYWLLKFNGGPTARKPTQPLIPVGSVIKSVKLRLTPSATSPVNSPTMRIGAVDLVATESQSVTYQSTNASWVSDTPVSFAEFDNIWMPIAAFDSGSRIDDLTTTLPTNRGASNKGRIPINLFGASNEEGVSSTEQKMVIPDPGGGAFLDAINIEVLGPGGSPTGNVWLEAYNTHSTGVNTNSGSLLFTTDTVAISALPNGLMNIVTFDIAGGSGINLGAGSQTIYVSLKTDATEALFTVGAVPHSTASYTMRTLGSGAGFSSLIYPLELCFPNLTTEASDTVNSNIFGSMTDGVVQSQWTSGVVEDFSEGMIPLVQAIIDDPNYYESGGPFALFVEFTAAGGAGQRVVYQSISAVNAPELIIEFTEPLGYRLKSHYGW